MHQLKFGLFLPGRLPGWWGFQSLAVTLTMLGLVSRAGWLTTHRSAKKESGCVEVEAAFFLGFYCGVTIRNG